MAPMERPVGQEVLVVEQGREAPEKTDLEIPEQANSKLNPSPSDLNQW